ncbi:MAG TPA: ATP-binding cassette domain-containing protein, partial [Umezawaea sp.]|nr:ATP-binding cassette domain-containing protein [Umezawaea sp.]
MIIYALTALSRALRGAGVPLGATLFGLLVVERLVPAATALAVAALVDQVYGLTGSTPANGIAWALGALLAVLLLGHLADAGARPLEFLVRARVNGAHRTRVVALLNARSTVDALETPEVQQSIRAVSADPENLVDYTPADGALGLLRVMAGLLGLLASSLVVATYSWWLVPVLVVPALLIWFLRNREAFSLVGKLRFAYREEMFADVWRRATVSPSEGKDIRVFGLAEWMVSRMEHFIRTANTPFWDHVVHVIKNRWWQLLLVLAGLVPAYLAVTTSAVSGTTSVAVQTAVFAAGWSLFQALGTSDDIQRVVGAVHVLGKTDNLAARLDVPGLPRALPPPERHPTPTRPPVVRLENVGFTYRGSDRPVLSGVDLTIHPGELLAIVGMNGAGKSTLIKLLSGLYRPTEGRITVDGVDIDDLGLQRWRSQLSVVFQDFTRYQLLLGENIGAGD